MSTHDPAITRARQLATAQCTNGEIAAVLVVEFGWSLSQAQEWTAGNADDLLTCKHYGRSMVRIRTYDLATMSPDDCIKANRNSLAAMEWFGRAYLNLDEHEKIAALVEAAERKLAKGQSGLRVAR